MAIARAHLVNPALARWYHCPVTRDCVRRTLPAGGGQDNRKVWIGERLQELRRSLRSPSADLL